MKEHPSSRHHHTPTPCLLIRNPLSHKTNKVKIRANLWERRCTAKSPEGELVEVGLGDRDEDNLFFGQSKEIKMEVFPTPSCPNGETRIFWTAPTNYPLPHKTLELKRLGRLWGRGQGDGLEDVFYLDPS